MRIPYQAFNCKPIILLIAVVFISILSINHAFAYDSLFVVEDVKVDVTAENSVIAGERALEKAQTQAFMILAKRMVDDAQAKKMATPDSLTISSLVKDYEITNEQLSAVRYVGTYVFRFRAAAVSKFFSVSGVSFTDKSSNTLLVLPILQDEGKNILWSEDNIWMQAWATTQISSGIVPVEVPIGDLMDITDINEDNALRYERRNLDRMLARYNAKEAAIMIAIPDDAGNLRISIYRTDRLSADHVRDINITRNGGESLEQTYERAVKNSYSALQKDWKSKTLSSSAQDQMFLVRIPLQNITQWVQIDKALRSISGFSDPNVIYMKKTEARLSFKFRGDEALLRNILSRYNLFLGQAYANGSVHKFTNNERAESKLIYDLTYGKKRTQAKPNNIYQNIEPASGDYTF